jgi:hypothetical protein
VIKVDLLNFFFILILFSKKSKLASTNRLPSLYAQTLIKSEFDYRREIRRKLDQLQHDNRDTVRRRLANDYLFTHEHLTKRYQWFNLDKSYRDTCRTMWNKQTIEKNRTSHVFLPSIYPREKSLLTKNSFQIQKNENSVISDEKIKQKFLHIQPVMLEILNAPHSSRVLKSKQKMELRKKSALKKHLQIQTNATDDQRYTQLVFSLQDN